MSSVTADAFAYGLRPAEARALVAGPWRTGVWVDYPGYPRLRLFTDRELGTMFESSGLRVEQVWGIHALTNLMPSPVLHRPRLPAARCDRCTARSARPIPGPAPPRHAGYRRPRVSTRPQVVSWRAYDTTPNDHLDFRPARRK